MINYDRHIFDIIDNEEKAYWLGFIVADGYINQKRHTLQIKLGSQDGEKHLSKFINFIGGKQEELLKTVIHNTTKKTLFQVSLYSSEITTALNNLLVFQAKSCKEEIPPIKDIYYRSFIKGLWDGDGFIRENLNGIGVTCSKEICSFCQEVFFKELGVNKLKIYDHYTTAKIEYRSKASINKILNYLYNDSMQYSLERKYQLASKCFTKI